MFNKSEMFLCFSFLFAQYLTFCSEFIHSPPSSSVTLLLFPCPVSFHFTSSSLFVLHRSYAMHVFAGAFGHKLFCWLNICYLRVYPFALPPLPFYLALALSLFPPSLPLFHLQSLQPVNFQTASLAFIPFLLSPPSLQLSIRLISFQIFASEWPYSSSVLSCPAKIRWCPGLLTLYYWAELALLQELTIHIITTAWRGYSFYCVSPLCLPHLCWLRPGLIDKTTNLNRAVILVYLMCIFFC